jgi:membrane-associated protein
VSSIVSGLIHLSGWVALTVIGALVFGETAVFLGFVLPGETAAVIGGVLASRGHLSLPALAAVVVAAAVIGPVVGYEIGRRMGDRLFAASSPGRIAGGLQRATSVLRARGGLAVFLGRFVVFLRAVMPAAAGAARVPYRTFLFYNVVGGLIWGVGYCLLGYAAGSAYSAIESRVGAGLAIAVAAIVVAGLAVWAVRRHRTAASRAEPAGEVPTADLPSAGVPSAGVPSAGVPSAGVPSAGVTSGDVPPGGATPEGETAGGEMAETAVSETVIGETAGAVPASGLAPPAGDDSPLR